jgi:hypothetical protein
MPGWPPLGKLGCPLIGAASAPQAPRPASMPYTILDDHRCAGVLLTVLSWNRRPSGTRARHRKPVRQTESLDDPRRNHKPRYVRAFVHPTMNNCRLYPCCR